MKVVHVIDSPRRWGGTYVAARRIHEMLLSRGDSSIIVCLSDVKPTICYELKRFAVRVLMKIIKGTAYTTGLVGNYKMLSILNAKNADCIWIHSFHGEVLSLKDLRRLNCREIRVSLHDHWPLSGSNPNEYPPCGSIDQFLQRCKLRAYRQIKDRVQFISHSRYMYRLARQHLDSIGCQVVHVAIPIPHSFSPDTSVPRDNGCVLFVNSSSLDDPAKGFDRLRIALQLLKERGIRVDLKIAARLEERQLIYAFRNAAVLAFPSRIETLGLVKMEAQACGCPVVAFNETAAGEGVVNGVVVPPGDVVAYASALEKYLS